MTSKFALVIANTEYQDAGFAKLTAPGKDAEEFAQVLRDPELTAFDDVQVLINESEGKTRRAIARFFAKRKRDDLLLLYFSGHGIRSEQGQLFLATKDTDMSILEATGIPAEFITYSMNNSRSQRQLLILDCCNSGAFAHGSKSASTVGKSMGMATAFEGNGFGRVVLTATDATQYAWEGDKIIGDTQKSVFTHFLIEGLKGEADHDGDGRIHVDELYDYAYEQVVRRTPKQIPGKWSYKQQGDMFLRQNLKPGNVKPAEQPPDLLELLSHSNSSLRKAGVQDLISLLEGKHLGLAHAAEDKLYEMATTDDSRTLRKTARDALIAHGRSLERPIRIEGIPEKSIEEKKPILEIPSPAKVVAPSNKITFSNGMELVRVPAGKFLMGSTKANELAHSNERPQHTVDLSYDYFMARFPVTNELYNFYVKAAGIKHPVDSWGNKKDHPVVNVSWNDTMEYCKWLNHLFKGELPSGLVLRLPTEAEWEKAARGTDGREFPWGNQFDKKYCNSDEGNKNRTTPVDSYSPQGDSPYGCADMAGNVWEWTHSKMKKYPYKVNGGHESISGSRVLRGGSFDFNVRWGVRCACRNDSNIANHNYNIGFRVVVSPIFS
jgi:formylglycine-generating enzyme required for sulfatase activity